MKSNAARGAYYKSRTRKWLLDQGYQVLDLEVVHWIHKPDGERIPVKRDQMASDLLAIKGDAIIFIQVKGGASAAGGTFPAARRKFAEYSFPSTVQCWVIAWPIRSREPRIVTCERTADGEITSSEARFKVSDEISVT